MFRIILCGILLSHWVLAETFSDKGFSLFGEIKYKELKHFDYVNPNAPKAGNIKLYELGSYDTLNPIALKGIPAAGLELLYDTLTVRSEDEPFSEYGLIAERIQRDVNNQFVIFHLNKKATFHDGSPVSAFDVEFSFKAILESQNPVITRYYQDVAEVVVVDKWTVRFNFKNNQNKELPLILGQIQIFPKKFYEGRKFGENPLEIPLGGGPYMVESIEAGKKISYKLAENYWAKDHPTRIGQFNFKKVTYEYYKDDTVALEAFKAGVYDYRQENSAKNWALAYAGNALKKGYIKKEELSHSLPSGMQGFFFNTRKEIFKDIRVRKALGYAFNFEWSNKNLFFSQYTRTKSYFDNSPLASFSVPLEKETAILKPFSSSLPQELFTQPFVLPIHKQVSNDRGLLKKAQKLLADAGYKSVKGKLQKDGKPLAFELILVSPAMERVAIPFKKNLSILGIDMKIRTIDTTQYINRLRSFDYDMVVGVVPQSLSPGNEQRFFFSSQSADEQGSRNYAGIKNEVVDALIEKVIFAKDRGELVDYTRALDRVLLWNYYVIPHFHNRSFRVAYWDRFSHPKITPLYGIGFWSWWIDEAKDMVLMEKNPKLRRK
ncbi:ABC transporter substrate-binding protein [Helicobacter monodelphidis]|uniref:extracellular solute-binding protein n=1 Tax=Helicobacter sp. 15-1451 TaxID=2004995 RepID=UPI000DCC0775|nr:extracellular solute-binding protein [Helicobacter sp. 15-1451]RAX57503.1 ABC transporter substrate-binding protein [Helicobacter sp. 15-1451]